MLGEVARRVSEDARQAATPAVEGNERIFWIDSDGTEKWSPNLTEREGESDRNNDDSSDDDSIPELALRKDDDTDSDSEVDDEDALFWVDSDGSEKWSPNLSKSEGTEQVKEKEVAKFDKELEELASAVLKWDEEDKVEAEARTSAAKRDDAVVQVEFWDKYILDGMDLEAPEMEAYRDALNVS